MLENFCQNTKYCTFTAQLLRSYFIGFMYKKKTLELKNVVVDQLRNVVEAADSYTYQVADLELCKLCCFVLWKTFGSTFLQQMLESDKLKAFLRSILLRLFIGREPCRSLTRDELWFTFLDEKDLELVSWLGINGSLVELELECLCDLYFGDLTVDRELLEDVVVWAFPKIHPELFLLFEQTPIGLLTLYSIREFLQKYGHSLVLASINHVEFMSQISRRIDIIQEIFRSVEERRWTSL